MQTMHPVVPRRAFCSGNYPTSDAGSLGCGLHEHLAPASRSLLGVFGSGDRGSLRHNGMGKCQGQAGSSSADVDASAPLGGYFGHDEYRAAIPCSANATHASDKSGASDIARAWHVSRWRQFSVLANLLSGTGDGARRSGDRVVQTVRPVLVSGRNISRWTCHGILAAPDGQTLYRLAAMRPYERLCVVGPD